MACSDLLVGIGLVLGRFRVTIVPVQALITHVKVSSNCLDEYETAADGRLQLTCAASKINLGTDSWHSVGTKLSIHVSTCLPIYLSICLSVYLSIHLCVHAFQIN